MSHAAWLPGFSRASPQAHEEVCLLAGPQSPPLRTVGPPLPTVGPPRVFCGRGPMPSDSFPKGGKEEGQEALLPQSLGLWGSGKAPAEGELPFDPSPWGSVSSCHP